MHTTGPLLFRDVSLDAPQLLTRPLVTRFLVPNPLSLLRHPEHGRRHGVYLDLLPRSLSWRELARFLPVIYLADCHPEFGHLGLALTRRASLSLRDLYPALRKLRDRPIYAGGTLKQGAALLMVHKIAGFPENRVWKGLPGESAKDFKLFFSPDIGMANELCLTNDAKPTDFKFFEYTTIWAPGQLEREMRESLWLSVRAPVRVLFDDNPAVVDHEEEIDRENEEDERKEDNEQQTKSERDVPSLFERLFWSMSEFPSI